MRLIKRGDTSKPLIWRMVDSSDHITGKTGLSPTVVISKNGGSFVAVSGTVSEIGYGWYKLLPAATDVDTLGSLLLYAQATGADPASQEYQVVAFDPYDADSLGLTNIPSYIAGSVVADSGNNAYSFKTDLSGNAMKFIGSFLRFTETAAAANEYREIIDFNATSGVVTVNKAFSTTPADGDMFLLIGYSGR